MRAAIALSHRGRGRTGSNPNVGCIIVKDGAIIGRGWTQAGGRPHAEAMALAQAGSAAAGSHIYTTLEPCAHDSERGPTCADLISAAKPARLIIAAFDPDTRTNGQSAARLSAEDISVSHGICALEARSAMAGFFCRTQYQRPHITLKLAMSLDGCIAMKDGSSQWITGSRARAHGHIERACADAILVGSGTLETDQPQLNVRLEGLEDHSPQRILLGSRAAPDGWQRIGSLNDLTSIKGNWLLVEGGARTAASFLAADLVDRLLLYRAPIIIGGGLPAISDIGLTNLSDAHGRWLLTDRRKLGQDMLEIYGRAA